MRKSLRKSKSKLRQYGESFAIAVLIALSVKSLVFAAYTIPSGSMEPTLLVGDYLIANRLSYVVKVPLTDIVVFTLGEPDRGDIIIFRYPEDRSKDFVKRVIAKGGDIVEIRDKALYVNGLRVDTAGARFIDRRVIPRLRFTQGQLRSRNCSERCLLCHGRQQGQQHRQPILGFPGKISWVRRRLFTSREMQMPIVL